MCIEAYLALTPAALAAALRACPEAMEQVGEFRPMAAAYALTGEASATMAEMRPLTEAIADLIEGWPPAPRDGASLEELAAASSELRRLNAAITAGYEVDQGRLEAAKVAFEAAFPA